MSWCSTLGMALLPHQHNKAVYSLSWQIYQQTACLNSSMTKSVVIAQNHKPLFMSNPIQIAIGLLTVLTEVCQSVYWLSSVKYFGRFIDSPHWGVLIGLLTVLNEVCQSVDWLSALRCASRFIDCPHWSVLIGLLTVLNEVWQSVYWLSSLH